MPEATVVDAGGDLDWADFDIPDSNVPVRIATLRTDPSRALTLFVRFPEGWERPPAGSYSSAEELVLLEGTLEMSGRTFEAGDWAHIPAGTRRIGSAARADSLSLARFDGPARWSHDSSLAAGSILITRLESGPASGPSPLGPATLLCATARVTSWLLEAPAPGGTAPFDVELLALESRTWAWVPAGAPFPVLEGLCFCRTFEVQEEP